VIAGSGPRDRFYRRDYFLAPHKLGATRAYELPLSSLFKETGVTMRKTGNGLPKTGNSLHLSERATMAVDYESQIAAALRRELGGSRKAAKTLMRWTGASERTSKNWLSGSSGPNGLHLVLLMGFSDAVFDTVLKLAKRKRDHSSERVANARSLIEEAVSLLA